MDKKEFFIKLLDTLLKNPKVIVFLWLSLFGFSGYSVLDYMDVGVDSEERPVVELPTPVAAAPVQPKIIRQIITQAPAGCPAACKQLIDAVNDRVDEFHK